LELQGDEGEQGFYLGITSTEGAEKSWRIEVLINNKKVQFKVSIGAEVTKLHATYDGQILNLCQW